MGYFPTLKSILFSPMNASWCSLIQFWPSLPKDSIRCYRLRAWSHKTDSSSDTNFKHILWPWLWPRGYKLESSWLTPWVPLIFKSASQNLEMYICWRSIKDIREDTDEHSDGKNALTEVSFHICSRNYTFQEPLHCKLSRHPPNPLGPLRRIYHVDVTDYFTGY